jgi:hypothetical protein
LLDVFRKPGGEEILQTCDKVTNHSGVSDRDLIDAWYIQLNQRSQGFTVEGVDLFNYTMSRQAYKNPDFVPAEWVEYAWTISKTS